jgi:hypothetical protein
MVLSLWLTLKQPQAGVLQSLIDANAAAMSVDPFCAHVTLLGLVDADVADVAAAVAAFTASTPPLTLPIVSVSTGPQFFFCVYAGASCPCRCRPVAALTLVNVRRSCEDA